MMHAVLVFLWYSRDHLHLHSFPTRRSSDLTPYHHQPFFYSDLFDLGYEAVGDLDPRLETVEDWKEPFRKGVVYRSEEHTSELQSRRDLVCRLLLEKKNFDRCSQLAFRSS